MDWNKHTDTAVQIHGGRMVPNCFIREIYNKMVPYALNKAAVIMYKQSQRLQKHKDQWA